MSQDLITFCDRCGVSTTERQREQQIMERIAALPSTREPVEALKVRRELEWRALHIRRVDDREDGIWTARFDLCGLCYGLVINQLSGRLAGPFSSRSGT